MLICIYKLYMVGLITFIPSFQLSDSNSIKNKYFYVLKKVLESTYRDTSIYSITYVYLKKISRYSRILIKFIRFCVVKYLIEY